MLTTEENLQIRNYLLAKKLPWDILLEVEDHMKSQVSNVESDTGKGFDDAFAEVKASWEEELKSDKKYFTTYNEFKSTPLVRKIFWAKRKQIIFKSILWGIPLILLLGIIAHNYSQDVFIKSAICLMVIISSVPFLYYLWNFRSFRFTDKFPNRVSMFQREGLVWVLIMNTFNISTGFYNNKADIYPVVIFQKSNDPFFAYLFLSLYFFMIFNALFTFFFYQKFVKAVKLLKPQLS